MNMSIAILTENGVDEYLLLQLQGTVEADNPRLAGQTLGELQIKGTKAEMIIGNHHMRGKVQDLSKPFALMKKGSNTEEQETRHYIVEAIVRRKVVFNTRPKPLVVKKR
eukprot:TRINITY_DN12070_c0_g2_i1.p1 TRINITY_DN12070_c0_g2~~TRINITY_DN12070_c0_g2_i1.p1  ORF type:complete len:109 (+),score=27.42 TRINITY_DN12070_c0_g2_i1:622-948(+)